MKLFLASEGVPRPELLTAFVRTSHNRPKVALINNAQDPYPEDIAEERAIKLNRTFDSLSFQSVNVDLRTYAGRTEALLELLKTCDLIWCSGGNSFSLRYAMMISGFDTIIKTLLSEGIVYGGWSAGAVVAGPSLHPIELMDNPGDAQEVVWEGLNLVNCFIWPHWDKEKYLPLQKSALEEMKSLAYESMVLKDGEVLIVENGQKRTVT